MYSLKKISEIFQKYCLNFSTEIIQYFCNNVEIFTTNCKYIAGLYTSIYLQLVVNISTLLQKYCMLSVEKFKQYFRDFFEWIHMPFPYSSKNFLSAHFQSRDFQQKSSKFNNVHLRDRFPSNFWRKKVDHYLKMTIQLWVPTFHSQKVFVGVTTTNSWKT